MKKQITQRQGIICLILLMLLGTTVALTLWTEKQEKAEELENGVLQLTFSQESGLYEQELMLQLTAGRAESIYYTLDGTQPVPDSAMHYDPEEGITLECGEQEQVYTVKAVGYSGEAACTPVETRSYIVGNEVLERYQTPVLLVTGDPADLLDPESGVFQGENRELRGRANEKEIHVTLFDEGEEVLNQNAGLRIYGTWSRNMNQPSFRLYARSEYDEQNWFKYLFFDDSYNSEKLLTDKYKRVIVRNSGDDNGLAYLRNELALRLSREAGYPDTQCASPVCVYINGEYYGVYWFVTNYDDWYFENKYGAYDGEMVVLSGAINYVQAPGSQEENEAAYQVFQEYNEMYNSLAYYELDDENWEILNKKADVENFIQHFAIQNYFCNMDCLFNNFKVYRYVAPDGNYQEGTVFDGRYRLLLFDMDDTLNNFLPDDPVRSEVTVLSATERKYINVEHNALYGKILRRPEGREYYIRYSLSLLNYLLTPERTVPVMEEMHESHADELRYIFDETDLLEGNASGTPSGADYTFALNEVERIRQFLIDRPAVALEDIATAFEIDQTYELHITNEQQAEITVDFATFHDAEYRGTYFGEVPVILSAVPGSGYRFGYWLINGDVVEEEKVILQGDQVLEEGAIYAQCVLYPDETAGLMITAVKSRGTNDTIEVTNFGQESQRLSDYMMADEQDIEKAVRLPAVTVSQGESILLYCKNYTGAEALGKPGVGFNLKEGETLSLYQRKNGELLQSIILPQLGSKDGVYRMDVYSGEFREQIE